jgi:hypothetical protein
VNYLTLVFLDKILIVLLGCSVEENISVVSPITPTQLFSCIVFYQYQEGQQGVSILFKLRTSQDSSDNSPKRGTIRAI